MCYVFVGYVVQINIEVDTYLFVDSTGQLGDILIISTFCGFAGEKKNLFPQGLQIHPDAYYAFNLLFSFCLPVIVE